MQKRSAADGFRWSDVLLIALVLPITICLGVHFWLLAMLIRRLTRIPYWIAFIALYGVLVVPAWIYSDANVGILTVGSAIVLLSALLPRVFDDEDGILNGGNLEHAAQAHILLLLFYALATALPAAFELHSEP